MNSKLIYSLKNLAAKEDDTETERIKKSVLMVTVLFKSFGCIAWTTMYFSLGFTLASLFPAAYFIVLILATYYLYKTKNFDVALNLYTFFILLVPFLLQVSMGGFVNSGAVILWSVIAPTGALFFRGTKSGIIWFVAFMVLCVISAYYKFNPAQTIFVSDNTIKFFFLMNVIVICGFLLYTIAYFRELTSRQNNELESNYKNIEVQKHLVEEKQKEIVESITYAKRLQQAILPPQEFIDKHLPANFILYKPKDIVAGDFYWAEEIGNLIFIAAADSTGHGVPGAMVSVVCSNALNRAVKEFDLTDTGKILDKTRELVVETFAKSNAEVKDGMDISLLCIDKQNSKVFWSGANNPLWYICSTNENTVSSSAVENRQLVEVKADKQPIGKTDNPKPFTTHQLDYKVNTTFYLFTDGLADQFGGPKGKKFKYKQFEELLIAINDKAMQEQSNIINEKFEAWKHELEQVDDVCVIGVKI